MSASYQINYIRLESSYLSPLGHQIQGWNARGQFLIDCNTVKEAKRAGAEYIRVRGEKTVKRILPSGRLTRIDPALIQWVQTV